MKTVEAPVYLVLLHHPIVNRKGELVTTAVTNMDIHDISRSCRTFGVKKYFLVTPLDAQHELVSRILNHWKSDSCQQYHPDRFEAVNLAVLARDFAEVKAVIRAETGEDPEVVLTDASPKSEAISYSEYRQELEGSSDSGRTRPVCVVFGTGWGIAESFYPEVHRILAPVYGPETYNHLSVRSAVAIILDRLFGH